MGLLVSINQKTEQVFFNFDQTSATRRRVASLAISGNISDVQVVPKTQPFIPGSRMESFTASTNNGGNGVPATKLFGKYLEICAKWLLRLQAILTTDTTRKKCKTVITALSFQIITNT